MTSVIAPALYAEAGADINLTITGADLAATYAEGVTGTVVTQTVPAQPAEAATQLYLLTSVYLTGSMLQLQTLLLHLA